MTDTDTNVSFIEAFSLLAALFVFVLWLNVEPTAWLTILLGALLGVALSQQYKRWKRAKDR